MPNDKDSDIVEIIDDDPPPKAPSSTSSQHHQSSKHKHDKHDKHKHSSKKKDETTDVLKVISDIKQLNELSLGGIGGTSNGIGNGSSEPVSVIALNRNHNSINNKNVSIVSSSGYELLPNMASVVVGGNKIGDGGIMGDGLNGKPNR